MISVIIPTYNRAAVLSRAINSVLAQGIEYLEVVVVDDASSDQTSEVMKTFTDERIVYIRHSTNKGGAAARNTGIERSRGEFIAFLDSDDEWLPGKLQKQMDLFEKLDSSYGVIYTGIRVIFDGGRKTEELPAEHRGEFLNELLISNCIRTLSSIVVKRVYLQAIGGFDHQLRSCQDWDLYIRLMKQCKFDCIRELLVNYYVNKQDPARISNAQRSIIQGHESMARKFAEDYKKLSQSERVRYLESVSEMYSLGGSLRHPFGMMIEAFRLTGRLSYVLMAFRYCARFLKRKINQRYGY